MLKLGSLTSSAVLLGVRVRLCALPCISCELSGCSWIKVIFLRMFSWFRWRRFPYGPLWAALPVLGPPPPVCSTFSFFFANLSKLSRFWWTFKVFLISSSFVFSSSSYFYFCLRSMNFLIFSFLITTPTPFVVMLWLAFLSAAAGLIRRAVIFIWPGRRTAV